MLILLPVSIIRDSVIAVSSAGEFRNLEFVPPKAARRTTIRLFDVNYKPRETLSLGARREPAPSLATKRLESSVRPVRGTDGHDSYLFDMLVNPSLSSSVFV